MNKSAFQYLLEEFTTKIRQSRSKSGIPCIVKLSACLRFFAEGTYQKGVGRDYEVALAQSSFSEVLSEFLLAMEISLCSQWITYPTDAETKKTVKFFYEKFGIPGVLGCIDGTHVNIIAPKDAKHLYRNRKQKFSLNVTLVSMCH